MGKMKIVDLFCGAGGISMGFEMAGFKTVFAVEFNPTYAETYKKNFPKVEVFVGDIKEFDNDYIKKINNKYRNIDAIS
ncbi:MAG: DNA cytosine methyltransferase [Candidatus Enterosoma sp.]|nr:DNA cytosine methyltransferase [Candidatus Enterosoma sp.]